MEKVFLAVLALTFVATSSFAECSSEIGAATGAAKSLINKSHDLQWRNSVYGERIDTNELLPYINKAQETNTAVGNCAKTAGYSAGLSYDLNIYGVVRDEAVKQASATMAQAK